MAENEEADPSGPQRLRLTKAAIKALRPGDRPAVYWDTELKGLGLKVHPTGRATWIVQFRLKGDRAAKQPVIGTSADMSPEMARTRAKDLIDAARRGVDLLDQERCGRLAREAEGEHARQEQVRRACRLTVGRGVAETLHTLRQQPSPRTGRPRSAGYMADQERHLGALAGTLGGATAVEDVDWRAALRWLKDLSPATRTQAKAAARALIAWLIENEELAAGPLAGRWPKAKLIGRDVTPSPAEVARLLLAAERLALPAKGRGPKATRGDRASIDPVWRDLLHVIALTGCRRSEAAAMRIEDIDLAAGIWRQPSTINKARREHLVPLNVMVADRLRTEIGERRSGLVFPGRTGGPVSGWSRMWATIIGEAGVSCRLHDLRRALVTAIGESGEVSPDALDQLLNHAAASTAIGVRKVYQRASYLPAMRKAVELWAGMLAPHLGRQATVVPLTRSATKTGDAA